MSDKPQTIIRAGDTYIPPELTPVAGFVYMLQPTGHNVYKIGCTVDLDRRVKTMRNKYGFDVEYIATAFYIDYNLAETAWHEYFKSKKLISEWFLLSDEDVKYFIETTS